MRRLTEAYLMVNRDNYHLCKGFLRSLREDTQVRERSASRYWFYLRHLLLWLDEAPFTEAPKLRPSFPNYLASVETDEGEALAPTTAKKVIQVAKRLLTWGKVNYPRQFNQVSSGWIDSLQAPQLIALPREHVFVKLKEAIQLATLALPQDDLTARRDQAGLAMLFVSGMRAGALGSLPIESVDLPGRAIRQWPALGVRTKRNKTATTYLLEIPELLNVVQQWDAFVRAQLPPTAMWYTPIVSPWGQPTLSPERSGENRNAAIIKRTRLFYERAGLPYKSPHKMRHGHAVFALQHARTMADYKAVSQNLMHDDIKITDGIYAPLLGDEIRQRIAHLTGQPAALPEADSDLTAYLHRLSKGEMTEALHILADALAQ
jgi:integrase